MTSGTTLWYLTRGSGVVALVLLTATTLLGVLAGGRWRSERWPRFAVANLHRNLTLLALAFIGVHIGTTIGDGYAPIAIKDIFIPFVSHYRAIWLGLGALALDLLLAITVTSILRRFVGYRVWRLLHWAAYATWPLALAHGLGTGSDARFGWMTAISFACMAVVVAAVAGRLVTSRTPALQLAAGIVTVSLVVLIGSWYTTGPAKKGWASRAGTPKSLLKATTPTARQLVSQKAPAPSATTHFRGSLVGRTSASGPDQFGNAAIAIAMAVRGSEPGTVQMTIWGSSLQDGGLAMSRSQVTFQDAATGIAYTGSIVGLNGTLVTADVTSSSGSTLRLVMRLQLTRGSVTGSIRATQLAGGPG